MCYGIAARDHREIAEVERNRFDGDQDFAGTRLRNRDFVEHQLVDGCAAGGSNGLVLRAVSGAAKWGALITSKSVSQAARSQVVPALGCTGGTVVF